MKKSSTKDILVEAKALLSEGPHRWTQGTFARRDEYGNAKCFCARGAVDEASDRLTGSGGSGYYAQVVLDSVVREELHKTGKYDSFVNDVLYGCPVVYYNDAVTDYPGILRMFDKAIAAAEGE